MLARSVPASVGCRVCEEKKRACRLVVVRKIPSRSAWDLVAVGALVAGDTPTFPMLDFWLSSPECPRICGVSRL